jgi:hypothetical protein
MQEQAKLKKKTFHLKNELYPTKYFPLSTFNILLENGQSKNYLGL